MFEYDWMICLVIGIGVSKRDDGIGYWGFEKEMMGFLNDFFLNGIGILIENGSDVISLDYEFLIVEEKWDLLNVFVLR